MHLCIVTHSCQYFVLCLIVAFGGGFLLLMIGSETSSYEISRKPVTISLLLFASGMAIQFLPYTCRNCIMDCTTWGDTQGLAISQIQENSSCRSGIYLCKPS